MTPDSNELLARVEAERIDSAFAEGVRACLQRLYAANVRTDEHHAAWEDCEALWRTRTDQVIASRVERKAAPVPSPDGAAVRDSDAAEADRYFDLAGEFSNRIQRAVALMEECNRLGSGPATKIGEQQILDEARGRYDDGRFQRCFAEGAGWGLKNRAAVGVTREGLAEACIRRLARCNINNAGQRDMAADDILSTLQKIEAIPVPDATVSTRDNRHCPNGLEHGRCLYPDCVSSCPGRLSLSPQHVDREATVSARDAVIGKAVTALLHLADATYFALEDSETRADDSMVIDAQNGKYVCHAMDELEALPDDHPGYTMTPNAKARWALRSLTSGAKPRTTASTPVRSS